MAGRLGEQDPRVIERATGSSYALPLQTVTGVVDQTRDWVDWFVVASTVGAAALTLAALVVALWAARASESATKAARDALGLSQIIREEQALREWVQALAAAEVAIMNHHLALHGHLGQAKLGDYADEYLRAVENVRVLLSGLPTMSALDKAGLRNELDAAIGDGFDPGGVSEPIRAALLDAEGELTRLSALKAQESGAQGVDAGRKEASENDADATDWPENEQEDLGDWEPISEDEEGFLDPSPLGSIEYWSARIYRCRGRFPGLRLVLAKGVAVRHGRARRCIGVLVVREGRGAPRAALFLDADDARETGEMLSPIRMGEGEREMLGVGDELPEEYREGVRVDVFSRRIAGGHECLAVIAARHAIGTMLDHGAAQARLLGLSG